MKTSLFWCAAPLALVLILDQHLDNFPQNLALFSALMRSCRSSRRLCRRTFSSSGTSSIMRRSLTCPEAAVALQVHLVKGTIRHHFHRMFKLLRRLAAEADDDVGVDGHMGHSAANAFDQRHVLRPRSARM